MYPVPTIAQMSAYSGRDEATYASAVANAALMQATIRFTFLTEISDPSQIRGYNALTPADMQQLAQTGIVALADDIYLKFPYQQAMASPLQSETIGSYNYQKSLMNGAGGGSMSRMAPAALELSMATTGITLFDMAVQILALRTITSGVFHEGMSVFDEGERNSKLGAALYVEDDNGRRFILGPEDHDRIGLPFDVNAQAFPQDPGVLVSACCRGARARGDHLRCPSRPPRAAPAARRSRSSPERSWARVCGAVTT